MSILKISMKGTGSPVALQKSSTALPSTRDSFRVGCILAGAIKGKAQQYYMQSAMHLSYMSYAMKIQDFCLLQKLPCAFTEKRLEAWNFRFKKRNCTSYVAKSKAVISNCTADQGLCICYRDNAIPLLLIYKISSFLYSFVTV